MMGMATGKVRERMENILCDHTDCLVLLKQLPFISGVDDHPLHDVVYRDEPGKNTVAGDVLKRFELESDNTIFENSCNQFTGRAGIVRRNCHDINIPDPFKG